MQCWAHCRRGLFEAQRAEPESAGEGLSAIAAIYEVEEETRERKLSGKNKRLHRLLHDKPLVEQFFSWVDQKLADHGLLPSNPLTKALVYACERRVSLEVVRTDPDVPIDTNHLERALRAIPMGRRA